jgi:hypothetical protein
MTKPVSEEAGFVLSFRRANTRVRPYISIFFDLHDGRAKLPRGT